MHVARRAAVGAAAALALAACTAADAGRGEDVATEDRDAVQTDAAPTGPELVVTFAEFDAAARSIVAGASVQGLVEEGGTCVLSVSPATGGGALTVERTAEAGPSSTDCGALEVPLPDEATGTWRVEVAYASPGTRVTSPGTEVQVP